MLVVTEHLRRIDEYLYSNIVAGCRVLISGRGESIPGS